MRLVLATRNPGKIAEIRRLLDGLDWDVVGLPPGADVLEDGSTFSENATKKARAAARPDMWVLADDSGLEVDALGGEPGVSSARYCGEGATDRDRSRKVLERLIAVPDHRRTARFRCVMCLIDDSGGEHLFEGRCEGKIAHHARGTAGFGYDPIFMPDGHARTFAELGVEAKNAISHRAQAMRKVVEYLRTRAPRAAGH